MKKIDINEKIASVGTHSHTSCGLLQVSLNPVRVMKHEADEEKAEIARLSSFVGAMAVGDLVKTTLGPRGMDKILWGMGRNEGQVQVTNDGATILRYVNSCTKELGHGLKNCNDILSNPFTKLFSTFSQDL